MIALERGYIWFDRCNSRRFKNFDCTSIKLISVFVNRLAFILYNVVDANLIRIFQIFRVKIKTIFLVNDVQGPLKFSPRLETRYELNHVNTSTFHSGLRFHCGQISLRGPCKRRLRDKNACSTIGVFATVVVKMFGLIIWNRYHSNSISEISIK